MLHLCRKSNPSANNYNSNTTKDKKMLKIAFCLSTVHLCGKRHKSRGEYFYIFIFSNRLITALHKSL